MMVVGIIRRVLRRCHTMVKCTQQILEPIMKLDVFAPEEKVGDVIQGQEGTPGGIRVKAEAPLSAMFGYIGDLRTWILTRPYLQGQPRPVIPLSAKAAPAIDFPPFPIILPACPHARNRSPPPRVLRP